MAGDRVDDIAALLIQTNQAHHQYEQGELKGVYDQDWPRWYAGFAVEQGISALLGHAVSVDQLTDFFRASFAEYQRLHITEAWETYTARQMQETL